MRGAALRLRAGARTFTLPASGGGEPGGVSGLQAWWDAVAITGASDGATLSSWSDETGNGNALSTTSGFDDPVYRASWTNSLPAVAFDTTTAQMNAASLFGGADIQTQDLSIVMVMEVPANDHLHRPMIIGADTGSSICISYGPDGSLRFNNGSLTSGSHPTTPTIFVITKSGTTYNLWRDGSNDIVDGSHSLGESVTDTIWIGERSPDQSNAVIGEVLVYDHALAGADRQAIESDLATKWGITL